MIESKPVCVLVLQMRCHKWAPFQGMRELSVIVLITVGVLLGLQLVVLLYQNSSWMEKAKVSIYVLSTQPDLHQILQEVDEGENNETETLVSSGEPYLVPCLGFLDGTT